MVKKVIKELHLIFRILMRKPFLLMGFLLGFLFIYVGIAGLIHCNFKCW